jgi:hypothetical protein
VKQQIKQMLQRLERIKRNESDDTRLLEVIDKKIAALEAERDFSQIWFHVDMDGINVFVIFLCLFVVQNLILCLLEAFFASVEIRDNPELRGKPIAVGDMSMISTSSYEV